MVSLSIFSFEGSKNLVFVQTHKANGYTTITDRDNNLVDVPSQYVTDLTGYPEQQERAKEMFNYINLERGF